MKNTNALFQGASNGALVHLHNSEWIEKQRIAGKIVAQTLELIGNLIKEKTSKSLIDLDKIANDFIISKGCTPTFLGYKGGSKIPYPNSVCLSVNDVLVHGVATDYKLNDGDVIKADLGCTYDRVIADAARTFIFGEPKSEKHIELLRATKECLQKGIDVVKIGKKTGAIGQAIYKNSKRYSFGLITALGGHSCSYNEPHHGIFIANKSNENEGITIQPGLTLAIEPLLCIGSDTTISVDNDGWSVKTKSIGAHWEDTIFVHNDGSVEIMTKL